MKEWKEMKEKEKNMVVEASKKIVTIQEKLTNLEEKTKRDYLKEKIEEWILNLESITKLPVTFRRNRVLERELINDMKKTIKEVEKDEKMGRNE